MLSAAEQEVRLTGIGSSEIAAIIGESPYSTVWKVWLEKTGRGRSESSERSDAGHGLEEWIASTASAKIPGFSSMRKGTTHVHPKHAHVVATPDYEIIVDDVALYDAILECKAVGFRVRHHWAEGVPTYVQAQVQWQMEVRDVDRTFVAAHLDGTSVDVFVVDRDRTVAAWLIDKATAFWTDHVLADIPPDVDGSKAAGEWLKSRLRTKAEKVVAEQSMLHHALSNLGRVTVQMKGLKAEQDRHRQEVLALSDDASVLRLPGDEIVRISPLGGKVRWAEVVKDLSKQLGLSKTEAEEIANGYRGNPSVRIALPKSWGAEENDE